MNWILFALGGYLAIGGLLAYFLCDGNQADCDLLGVDKMDGAMIALLWLPAIIALAIMGACMAIAWFTDKLVQGVLLLKERIL